MTISTVRLLTNLAACTGDLARAPLPFAEQTTAMSDNTGGDAFPLATVACLAVSAVSFMLGQAFDQRRRRRTATTLQDADFVMMPQLAAGKHEVGRDGQWRHGAIHHVAGWCRNPVLYLDHDWVLANRS